MSRDPPGAPPAPLHARGRVRFGAIWVDALTAGEALGAVERLVERGAGGAVFTPNVDHVVLAERDPDLRAAYARADLSLCDGQPLRWLSGWLGLRLPEKISGSDLFLPLMSLAARRGFRVFLLGGDPGVAEEAGARLTGELGVRVVGTACPRIATPFGPREEAVALQVAAARPDLAVVCLGAPKGERWIDRARDHLGGAVALQLGASMDFYVGRARRAPGWMQRTGLEWIHRLAHDPRRLARRYLVRDPAFVSIAVRTRRLPRAERVRDGAGAAAAHPAG